MSYKEKLREACEADNLPSPRYEMLGFSNLDGFDEYTARVTVGPHLHAIARCASKESAKEAAAKALMQPKLEAQYRVKMPGFGPTEWHPTERDAWDEVRKMCWWKKE